MIVSFTDGSHSAPSLAGLRVHVLRGGNWGDRVAMQIQARGGIPVVTEVLRIQSVDDARPLRRAASRWNRGEYEWLVLTSANGVDAFVDAGGVPRPDRSVAAVGPATAEALVRQGFTVDLMPRERFSAAGLVHAFEERLGGQAHRRCSMLLPISNLADQTLEGALTDATHSVERVTAYRTVTVPPGASLFEIAELGPDQAQEAILVTSSSAARAIAGHLVPLPKGLVLAAIGDPTADTLREEGLRPDVVAETHTIPGLLDALAYFTAAVHPVAVHQVAGHPVADSPTSVSSASAPIEGPH